MKLWRASYWPIAGLAVGGVLLAGCQNSGSATDSKTSNEAKGSDGKTTETADGELAELKVEDIKPGTGEPVVAGDTLMVKYTGRLKDGKVFDTNDKEGGQLFTFQAGPRGQVIEGWQKGVIGMKPGGVRKLSIPWRMAYGEQGNSAIPPKADLFFDIELVQVMKAGEDMTVKSKTIREGTGPGVKRGDTITIDFTGKTPDGTVLDKGPWTFVVGRGKVIAGVDAGVIGMKKGGTRRLTIPPNAAFGPAGKPPAVPPNTVLTYEITLKEIK